MVEANNMAGNGNIIYSAAKIPKAGPKTIDSKLKA